MTCMSEQEKTEYKAMLAEVERTQQNLQGLEKMGASDEGAEWDEEQEDEDSDASDTEGETLLDKAQIASIQTEKVRLTAMLKKKVQFYADKKITLLCKNCDGYSFDHHPNDMALQDRSFFDEAVRKKTRTEKSASGSGAHGEKPNEAASGSGARRDKRGASDGVHSKRKRRRTAPAGIEDQAAEDGRDGELSEDETDDSDEDVPGVVPDSEDHSLLPERSTFEHEGLDLDWQPWAQATSGTKFLWAQSRSDVYITEDVEDRSQLRIRNFAYRIFEKKLDIGRYNDFVKIQNICFFEGVGSTFCSELLQTLSEQTSAVVVASSPCVEDGEFDFTQIEGFNAVNQKRQASSKKHIRNLLGKAQIAKPVNDKVIRQLENELAEVSRIEYEYRKANTCYCGCGVSADGTHKCKVCKESFFPGCMHMEEDGVSHGVCLVCNIAETLLEQAVNELTEQSDDESSGVNDNDITMLPTYSPAVNARAKRPRIVHDDDKGTPMSQLEPDEV